MNHLSPFKYINIKYIWRHMTLHINFFFIREITWKSSEISEHIQFIFLTNQSNFVIQDLTNTFRRESRSKISILVDITRDPVLETFLQILKSKKVILCSPTPCGLIFGCRMLHATILSTFDHSVSTELIKGDKRRV